MTEKRNGQKRLIEAPKPHLKALQRRILKGLLDHIPTHPDAFGFIKSRNCLDGAARHASEAVVLRFDLEDFFLSVRAHRIHGLFRCLGYPHAVAQMLTALCTNQTPPRVLAHLPSEARPRARTPHLPQGAPTSPALANLASHTLDQRLAGLARHLGASYSRYADDMTFSGDNAIAGPLQSLVPEIVRDEGFQLNPAKTKRMPATTRQTVTGIVVNRHLNPTRHTFDRLKAIIHACSKADDARLTEAHFRASLLGQIGWIEQVNPARGRKLRHLLEKAWATRFS